VVKPQVEDRGDIERKREEKEKKIKRKEEKRENAQSDPPPRHIKGGRGIQLQRREPYR